MARRVGNRIVFPAAGDAAVEEFDIPEPGEYEILVATQYSLISAGTEMTTMVRQVRPQAFPAYPGYSNVGIVERAGRAVIDEFPPGTPVASTSNHSSHIVLDLNPGRIGPPEMVAPRGSRGPDYAQRLDVGVDQRRATFAVLGSVALHGIRRGEIQVGNAAVVFGQGVVGQLIAQLAKLSGCKPVIAVDLVESRLEKSKIAGADYTVNAAAENAVERIMEITGGAGAEILFDATRSAETIPIMMKAAAHFAKLMVVGSLPGTVETDFFTEFQLKELNLMGVFQPATPTEGHAYNPFTQRRNRRDILDFLESGAIKVDHLITHDSKWSEAPEIYSMIREGPGGWMGIVFDWTGD
jgi:2-desacetyl-2-hydroxyethyl bacteriochlorophyllide A dehydrogenase